MARPERRGRPGAAISRARKAAAVAAAPPFPAARLAALRRALGAWYRRNARAMPWRESRDPYRVWVSEIMLQQTQVATATPYFLRFVGRFPGVERLAQAPVDAVLAVWAGLGYYRRARRLHEAARLVVREHAGRVPRSPEAFGALPGVGPYTRGAVLSIAYGVSVPVLDGNVARVLARWLAQPLQVRRPADARALWAIAAALVPPAAAPGSAASPGQWNQALMELGATVCTPRAPRCGACPARRWCRAYALGRPAAFPPAATRRAGVRVRRALAWIEHGGRVLVVRCEGALLAGLWEPPGIELAPGAPAAGALRRALRALGLRARLEDTGARVRHAITHRAIEVEIWRGRLEAAVPVSEALRWCAPGARDLALTATARKVAAALGHGRPHAAARARPAARTTARGKVRA